MQTAARTTVQTSAVLHRQKNSRSRAGLRSSKAFLGSRSALGSRCTFLARGRSFTLQQRRNICLAQLGIFFSTSTGHTEDIASIIKEELGGDAADPADIGETELGKLPDFDGLVVGAPTWNTDCDTERSGTNWDGILEDIKGIDLKDKPVAVFGLGDAVGYSEYFCDAMEEIYSTFKSAGAKMIGHWPADGYEHEGSKALLDDGTFCGLPLDEDNQDDMSADRIKKWVAQIKTEM